MAIPHLIQQLKYDPGINVSAYTAMALGMLKERKVIPELLNILSKIHNDQLKHAAREAILYIKNVTPCPYW
jgi:HEAT repeat protein